LGTVELVSLFFEYDKEVVFLVDLAGSNGNRVAALKKVFECESLEKVIHDSRMDCDALYHLHRITVKNVHDTLCFHTVITGIEDDGLNNVLIRNRLPENRMRDKSMYDTNYRFWAERPLTTTMIEWASSDVDKLLKVADSQIQDMASRPQRMLVAKEMSMEATKKARDMKLERGVKCNVPIGRFIGTRGSNLRRVQKETRTLIYKEHLGRGIPVTWYVYYANESDLSNVKRAMS
jgi:DNA polymerase I-like protein with 3'-5' exonuclease and polymerase domains